MGSIDVVGLSAVHRPAWFGGNGDLRRLREPAWVFGVSETQAARRGALMEGGGPGLRPTVSVPYVPRCRLRELRATGSLGCALTPRVSVFGTATGVRLERGAADSPLTRERNSWGLGMGLA